MEKISITFLGTGSMVTTISRNHTSIFAKYKDRGFLIDCGEGTQRQLRKAKINPVKITDLLITHFHGDHVFGIPGLLHTLNKMGYSNTLNIYGPKGSKVLINKMIKLFAVKLKIKIHEVDGKFIENDYFSIEARKLDHGVPCIGFRFEEKDRLRINKKKLDKLKIKDGEKIKRLTQKKNIKLDKKTIKWRDLTYLEKGRKIAFVLDTKLCNNVNKLIKEADLAIMEGAFLADNSEVKKMAKKYKHLTIEDASKVAKKNKVKELILTHISQRYEFNEKKLLEKSKKIFKNSSIAKDFMKIEI